MVIDWQLGSGMGGGQERWQKVVRERKGRQKKPERRDRQKRLERRVVDRYQKDGQRQSLAKAEGQSWTRAR